MTTGIPHGPLSSADLPKLTGRSVLLATSATSFWSVGSIFTTQHKGDHTGSWIEIEGLDFKSFSMPHPRCFEYLGERPEPGSPVILAPAGGWRHDPVGGRWRAIQFADNRILDNAGLGGSYDWSGSYDWPQSVSLTLIEDANPEAPFKCDQCNGDGYIYPNGIGDGHNLQEVCPTCGGAGGYDPTTEPRRAQALSDLAEMDAKLIGEAEVATPLSPKDAMWWFERTGLTPSEILAGGYLQKLATPASPPAETGEGVPQKRAERLFLQTGKTPRELHDELSPYFTRPSDQSDTERMRAALKTIEGEFETYEANGTEYDAGFLAGLAAAAYHASAALAEKEAGQ